MFNRLSQEQIEELLALNPSRRVLRMLDLGLTPLAGGAEDEGDEQDETEETPEDEQGEGADDAGSSDEGDEGEEADDEATAEFLKDVLKIPEIKEVVRAAAKSGAEAAGTSYAALRRELTEELSDIISERLEEVVDDLSEGKITNAQAKRKAEKIAKREAAKLKTDDSGGDEKDGKKDKSSEQDERERRIRIRELEAARRELIANEDAKSIIPELVVVTDETEDEDELEDQLDRSKKVRARIRREVIAELRASGWRGPRDADSDDDDEDDITAARRRRARSSDDGPRSRDRRTDDRLSKSERDQLRERFGYAKNRTGARTGPAA